MEPTGVNMPINGEVKDLNTRLAFLAIELFETGKAVRGAILITDLDTKPYEFRISSPVRPSNFQRTLYGNTLEEYMYVELISIPLIKELREEVDLIIITSPGLLRIRPKISIPVALISESDIPSSENIDEDKSHGKLLTITTHDDFPSEDLAARSLIVSIMQKRDLLEPFERIKIALGEAHIQRIGESTK
jgi:hypothetical protein